MVEPGVIAARERDDKLSCPLRAAEDLDDELVTTSRGSKRE